MGPDRMNESYSSPIYGRLRGPVDRFFRCFSLGWNLARLFDHPLWVAEIYQLGSLAFALTALFWPWRGRLPVAVALYKTTEIFLFAFRWAFVQSREPVANAKRSLLMFLINLVEVVLWFAVATAALGCVQISRWSDVARTVYSSLRTAVTIGPLDEGSVGCWMLYTAEITVAYFLTIVIIAGLLSAIQRQSR